MKVYIIIIYYYVCILCIDYINTLLNFLYIYMYILNEVKANCSKSK